MSSREKFESWYLDNWGHTEEHHETLFERSPDDESEYYRLGVRMAHQAWQAGTSVMEANCAALAAENAGLKELIEQHAGSIAACPNCSHEEPSETDDTVALYRSMETPATDLFISSISSEISK